MKLPAGFEIFRAVAAFNAPPSSGIVASTRGKLRRLVCVERGHVVHAVSNVLEEQFLERLVRDGVLRAGDRAELVRNARDRGVKPGGLLLEAAHVERAVVLRAMREHCREAIRDVSTWTDGHVERTSGKPNLDGEVTVAIPIPELVLDLLASAVPGPDLTRAAIGPPGSRLRVSKRLASGLDRTRLPPAVGEVFDDDGASTVAALSESSDAGEAAFLRVALGLKWLGIVEPTGVESKPKPGRSEISRREIEAWVSRASNHHLYDVLGVGRTANDEEIRRGYYSIARRLHPDRLRGGELADLVPQVEAVFARVTEAYNTLLDPDARAAYDASLEHAAPRDSKPDTADMARLNFVKGRDLAARGKYADAVSFLQNAVDLDGRRAEFLVELGRVKGLNPRLRDEAEEHLRAAIAVDPAFVDGYVALGEILEKAGRPEESVAAYREALRWEAGHAIAAERLASIEGDGGSPAERAKRGLFGR